MQYHINRQKQVAPCRALKNCPFKGDATFGKHFNTREGAEVYLQEKLGSAFPTPKVSKKDRTLSKFSGLRTLAARGLNIRTANLERLTKVNPKGNESHIDFVSDSSGDEDLLKRIRNNEISALAFR